MLQYILNLTATWLLSLVIFDLFLKKETYHTYNRIYLLSTFLIGIFLPFWTWKSDAAIYTTTLTQPVKKLVAVKQDLATAANTSAAISWQQYLWYLYLAGVAVSLVLLVFEASKIIVLYQVGNKSKEGKWTVVETVKGHAPFSIFHILFVDSKDQYTPEQWNIILDHEEQHSRLWHFADQLIVQLARIVFWFNPLVYIYNNRLMLLHEYQADKLSGKQPAIYGRFLVEQSLLHTAPKLAHSLNRSPIKTRIIMLTKTSSFLSKTKGLLFIPLVLICMVCFTKNVFSDEKKWDGNKLTYRGNVFETEILVDTIMMINPVTGKENMSIIKTDPIPYTINGRKMYAIADICHLHTKLGELANQPANVTGASIKEYLLANMKDEIAKLDDGEYEFMISYIGIDENGKIVYFDYSGIQYHISHVMYNNNGVAVTDKRKVVPELIQKEFAKKVAYLLDDAPIHEPAYVDGKQVPYLINTPEFYNGFTVKDHKVIKL